MYQQLKSVTNLDIVRCFYDGLDDGDVSNPLDYFSEDMSWYVSDFLPWGGKFQGMAKIGAMLRELRSKLTDTFEVDEIFQAGSEVIAIGRSVGFINETRENFSVRNVHVWRFENGRAVSLATYSDSDSSLSKLT